MRTIKFRGKRLDGQGWVYGFYLLDEQRKTPRHCIWTREFNGIGISNDITEVFPESVGQWTGLVDKHGKEIYEGDIVKTTALLNDHHQRGATVVSPVEYWHGATCLSITYVPLSLDFQVSHEIEIIGNIHDKICTYKDSGCGSCEVPSESRTCMPELMEVK